MMLNTELNAREKLLNSEFARKYLFFFQKGGEIGEGTVAHMGADGGGTRSRTVVYEDFTTPIYPFITD